MKEEYNEFQALLSRKGGDTNMMNVNFAPINTNEQNFIDIKTEEILNFRALETEILQDSYKISV